MLNTRTVKLSSNQSPNDLSRTQKIPLFPLQTVLFPGGPLPLRIFEPRYLDMISDCLKNDIGIGVVLIKDGKEVGTAAQTHNIGTISNITYWNKRSDGILGVTVRGEQRFQIINKYVEHSQLVVAEVELIPNEPECKISIEFEPLVVLLHNIIDQLKPPYTTMPTRFEDAGWVGARLVEFLPMELDQKQDFLKLEDPIERLDGLRLRLANMEIW